MSLMNGRLYFSPSPTAALLAHVRRVGIKSDDSARPRRSAVYLLGGAFNAAVSRSVRLAVAAETNDLERRPYDDDGRVKRGKKPSGLAASPENTLHKHSYIQSIPPRTDSSPQCERFFNLGKKSITFAFNCCSPYLRSDWQPTRTIGAAGATARMLGHQLLTAEKRLAGSEIL